jgi:hypothetical protein
LDRDLSEKFEENNESGKTSSPELPTSFSIALVVLMFLAVFGFLYNVSKVSADSTFTVFAIDAIAVSYTNLLAYPLLIFVSVSKIEGRVAFPDRKDYWAIFVSAPFFFIGFKLLFRIVERLW